MAEQVVKIEGVTPVGGALPVSGTVTSTPSGTQDVAVTSSVPLSTMPAAPAAANLVAGTVTLTNSVVSTPFLTIPANRTFVGTVSVSCANMVTTASYQTAKIAVVGVGALPLGDIMQCAGTRDTTVGAVTLDVTVAASAAGATLNLILSNAISTLSGTASAAGVLI